MSKDVEIIVESGKSTNRSKQNKRKENPMGSANAQKLLQEDLLKNPDAVISTTQALIDEGFLPSRQLLDSLFLDDDLYDCLIRLDKKDAATKFKALTDFFNLINTKESERMISTRTFWARLFVSFMEDEDLRIRELALKCQENYVKSLKKEFLPILKTVMGSWWLAQFQMHSAVATTAKLSFHSAFSEQKRPDVLKLASKEICGLLKRRILSKGSSKTKTVSDSSGKDDHEQRIAEALDALRGFVTSIKEETLVDLQPFVVELLDNPEFWKISMLGSPRVRQNFFILLRTLWERLPNVLSAYLKSSLVVVVGNLHDRDVRAAVATWDVLLSLLNSRSDWMNFIDVQKVLLPKLVAFLRHAGFGTAASTYPSVIVVLDKLPNRSVQVYDQILSALIQGASNENMRGSDILSVFRAICDVLNYAVKRADFAQSLVEIHLLPLLDAMLFGTGNLVRGSEIIFGMIFKWMRKNPGDKPRDFADLIWKELSRKISQLDSMDVAGIVRTQQWMIGLVGVESKTVLYGMIKNHALFQDFLFHTLRLAFQFLQSPQNSDGGKSLLTFLRSNRSEILYQRLADHLTSSVSEDSNSSPQAIMLSKFPDLSNDPVQLELLSILIQDCRSDEEARGIFAKVWTEFPEKVGLLQAIERYSGDENLRRVVSNDQLQDLVQMALSLPDLANFGNILDILKKFQVPFEDFGDMMMEKISHLPVGKQLAVMEVLFLRGNAEGISKEAVKATIVLTFRLARETEYLDADFKLSKDTVNRLNNLGKFLVRDFIDWSEFILGDFKGNGLTSKADKRVVQNTGDALHYLFISSNLSSPALSKQLSKICDSLEAALLSREILKRGDVFLCRINSMEINDQLGLENAFFDEKIRYYANASLFLNTILDQEMGKLLEVEQKAQIEELRQLIRSYLALASEGIVQDPEILAEVGIYRELLLPTTTPSFSPSFIQLLRLIGDTEIWSKEESILIEKPVHDLSESELITAYNGLWNTNSDISDATKLYRNDVRDRLEIIVAFSEFPRDCTSISRTTWSQIQLLRLAPSLLSERCVNLEYTGPVLDVFGTVVIDWIACLQDVRILEENVKVLVLVEEAIESVGNILKMKDLFKDSGILWVELTEFSFPRILASLLEGLFLIADANTEIPLSRKHPLFIKLVLKLCAVVCDFATDSQESLKIVWDTMYKLESGLPVRLCVLNAMPTEMYSMFIRLFAPLLLHKFHQFQVVAAEVLYHLLPSFPPTFKPVESAETDSDVKLGQQVLPLPVELLSLLEETEEIVDALMDHVPLGESFGDVTPETDSYTYLLGYFMLWRSIFAWIKNESMEARQAFSSYIDSTGAFVNLLNCLARFLPLFGSYEQEAEPDVQNASANLIYKGVPLVSYFEKLSQQVYKEALETMPNLARSWFGRKQGAFARELAKFTSARISPEIVKKELLAASAQAKFMTTNNFKVNVRPSVFEITAEYKVEIWVAEMVIKIPKDYPLGNVQVFWGNTKGNAMDAWDQWIIRLSAHLRKRNGTVLDGVLEWKKTVDKKFRDTAACSICLSIVDTKTSEMPKMQCKTCKNKFHSECLNRWFREQIDPTCPLCREKFFS